jgi:HB1, ASXL, restriction endonuclease HTH domain
MRGVPQRHRLTQKALAIEVLADAGEPLRLSELARRIEALGFRHSVKPKRANQLQSSLVALFRKDRAFKRVGRGLYDLSGQG